MYLDVDSAVRGLGRLVGDRHVEFLLPRIDRFDLAER